MSDEIPKADRTVTVEEANLLREQRKHSEEQASEMDDLSEMYHAHRAEYTQERIEDIEDDGISESEVEERLEELKEKIESTEPDTEERIEPEAEFDTERQINRRYFDNGPDVVEVEAIGLTGYEDGTVEFKDGSGKAVISFPSEADARGAADCILDCNGVEDEAARVGMR